MPDRILSPSLDFLACSSGYKFEWAVLPYARVISWSIKRAVGLSMYLLFSSVA